MTLVPAVLVLLGRHAWWLPRSIDRRLPEVDVEGAALHRKVAFETWQSEHGAVALRAQDLVLHEGDPPVQVVARPAVVTRVASGNDARALGFVLAGRERPFGGHLVVAGLLLPEQREAVNQVATLIDLAAPNPSHDVESAVWSRARLESFSRGERRRYAERALRQITRLQEALGPEDALQGAVVESALAIASNAKVAVLVGLEELSAPGRAERARRRVAPAMASPWCS